MDTFFLFGVLYFLLACGRFLSLSCYIFIFLSCFYAPDNELTSLPCHFSPLCTLNKATTVQTPVGSAVEQVRSI